MSSLLETPIDVAAAERWRVRWFLLLIAAMMLDVGIATAIDRRGRIELLGLGLVPYLGWVWCDLRARGVRGVRMLLQLLVTLIPFWGLLLYLLWSRGLRGAVQWLAFVFAFFVPVGMAAMLAKGITLLATGGRW